MTFSATILLVEDDQALLDGIADLLEVSALGYDLQVLKAANGQIGLQVLATQTPDLIISDIMMPRMDGYEFLQKVRQSPEWVHIPVIFLTAKGTKHDVLRGRLSGAELYIKKPYDSDELCQLVKSQLDRAFELQNERQRQVSSLSRNIVQLLHHEFRTPLTYVTAYHSLLADGIGQEEEGELHEYLDGIHAGARRMSALVGNLLRVLAIWSGDAAQEYIDRASEHSDLNDILGTICGQYAAEMAHIDGGFQCHIAKELPSWFGVIDDLEEIVSQLLANAVTFSSRSSGSRPEVSLSAAVDGGQLIIAVKDNGVGIPGNAQERIFDLFYQHDRPELEQQGAGAGLTIAQGLTELHGGRIEVESEAGTGSVFKVYLPLAPEAPAEESQAAPATVLLVEDEQFLLEGLRDLLESYDTRYQLSIMAATDGLHALELISQKTPDLIVSDIMMPRMNGYQFLTEVRANPEWVDIPVIFLTARGERQDVVLGLSSGAEEYVTKPYDVDELFGVISAQLDKHFLRQGVTRRSLEQLKVSVLELLLAEFSAPLDDVTQYSDRLSESLDEVHSFEQLRTYLLGLENGSSQVARLVEDFILLVELRTGEAVDWFKLQARPTQVNALLRVIGPRLQAGYDWLEVEIRYNLGDGDDEALIDSQLLGKCLERLVEETIVHCPQDRPVRVALASGAGDGQIVIEVGSSDADLSGETIDWLDDILASPNTFEAELRNFSLGLMLVKGIVHYHEGQLSVMRGSGHGLTFVLALPSYRQ